MDDSCSLCFCGSDTADRIYCGNMVDGKKGRTRVSGDAGKNAEKRQKVPEEEKKIDIPVDFDSLQKENPDIYAWITIPDTVIDYPIVQSSEDNAYYLNHSAEKTDSVSGAIYSENYNKKNFDDPITLLYGHNMKDGSMFAGLHKYEEDTYFNDHKDLVIYTPDAILKYKILRLTVQMTGIYSCIITWERKTITGRRI